MNITNLTRDCIWSAFNSKDIANDATIGGGSLLINSSGLVSLSTAFVSSSQASVSVAANNFAGIGVAMEGPRTEYVPYRVICKAVTDKSNLLTIWKGTLDALTGTNDALTQLVPLGRADAFDGIVMVPPLATTDPDYGKPIGFAVAAHQTSGDRVQAALSVQRLSVNPPQFATAVS